MSWKAVQENYRSRGMVLVLGAGISVGCGLPTWPNLLQRMLTDDLADDVDVSDLQAHGLSLPAIASLIEERMPDRRTFVECARAALYRDFPFYPDGIGKSNRRAYVRYIRETNSTLQAITALCALPNTGRRTFSSNPRIHALVTFNLDALLQAYVYARYEKRLLRTVERPSAWPIPGKISIYHMHGYLRFDQSRGDPTKEAPDAAVLTEQDYFDFFNQPTSLFNYTFLYLLREFPCCFIGLSMQDDNIRRLLHYSRLEQYQALRREGVDDPAKLRRELTRHFAVIRRTGQPAIDQAIGQSLSPLGVTVLWVTDFTAIPAQLAQLYEAAGDDWSTVF